MKNFCRFVELEMEQFLLDGIWILNFFSTVQPRVIFTTRRILPAIHKDVLPASQLSMVVYQYVCRCKCRYVGRTSQCLQDRICQHVPKTIHNKTNQERIQPTRKSKINSSTPNCDSAIGTHLLKHPNCALHYNDNQFSILSKARSEFHLAVLESIHIPQANLHCAVKKSLFIGLNYQHNYIGFILFFFRLQITTIILPS